RRGRGRLLLNGGPSFSLRFRDRPAAGGAHPAPAMLDRLRSRSGAVSARWEHGAQLGDLRVDVFSLGFEALDGGFDHLFGKGWHSDSPFAMLDKTILTQLQS